LDETEQKLKETNKIFEISRQKAKTAKERFNKIKEKRFVIYIYIYINNYRIQLKNLLFKFQINFIYNIIENFYYLYLK